MFYFAQPGLTDATYFGPTFQTGEVIIAQSQHIDDTALRVWMDNVVIPALDAVSDSVSRGHYPVDFQHTTTNSHIKRAASQSQMHNNSRVDTRRPVSSTLLEAFWAKIIELAYYVHIKDTDIPENAFRDACLVVSCHNLKIGQLGSHQTYTQCLSKLEEHIARHWNTTYIDPQRFYWDLGIQTGSSLPGTTTLRKARCNKQWADDFRHGRGHRTTPTFFTFAGTDAGSVGIELGAQNKFRDDGLMHGKVYNTNKELLYPPIRGYGLFTNPYLEVVALTRKLLNTWNKNERNGTTNVSQEQLFNEVEYYKERIRVMVSNAASHTRFVDRQELRISLYSARTVVAPNSIDGELHQIQDGENEPHRGFWILPTIDVNRFRAADCNRWLAALESIMVISARMDPTTRDQEVNCVMSTALVRTLNAVLDCRNLEEIPSLGSGKAYRRPRNYQLVSSQHRRLRKPYEKRQGLEYSASITKYGMIWIPYRLGIWNEVVPTFRLFKYPNLDVYYHVLHNSKRRMLLAHLRTEESYKMEYLTKLTERARDKSSSGNSTAWSQLYYYFAIVAIQRYNQFVWETIGNRWIRHMGPNSQANMTLFYKRSNMSDACRNGLEILSFQSVENILLVKLGIETLYCAKQQKSKKAPFFQQWVDATWKGRIAPLFTYNDDNPSWLLHAPHMKSILAQFEVFRTVLEGETLSTVCQAYQETLIHYASRYIQAILHYSKSRASELASIDIAGNSAATRKTRATQSDLERTKWMFPRIANEDRMQYYAATQNNPKRKRLTRKETSKILGRCQVFTAEDKGPVEESPFLMVDASQIGSMPKTLDALAKLEEEFKAWRDDQEDDQDESDSDWPDPPSLHSGQQSEASTNMSEEESIYASQFSE
ncbi:hypothetical protein N0V90_004054 [Kalmusia sp. IMI 367209]|nr:hypothetical protein N0V90_004054 [Kalmusia sp. IMI 367209]